ncbi:NlpC/P60 family protein [Fidelibacter multiformis]|uniref:C40 family peptidase n=1 Tax=Fidelibacter multiformis TaxID=3377529 RepID=UPI0037DC7C1F
MIRIVRTTFANVYEGPSFSSQMVTQGVAWEKVELLDRQEDWLKIRLPDAYEGWMQNFSTLEMPDEEYETYQGLRQRVMDFPFGRLMNDNGEFIGETVMGGCYPIPEDAPDCVILPSGVRGCVRGQKLETVHTVRARVVALAAEMMGTAYLWGGKTEYGTDCSGLVQCCFGIEGIQMPRDASKQIGVVKHKAVEPEEAEPGDLAFFQNEKGRIVHVAIMTGPSQFIHSSGEVKRNSFRKDHPLYSEKLASMLEGVYKMPEKGNAEF